MKKKSKSIFYIIIVCLIIILSFVLVSWQKEKQKKNINFEEPQDVPINFPKVMGNAEDFISFSIPSLSKVSGKVSAQGVIKGNYFFEGNIPIFILDAQGQVLLGAYGTATTEWMTGGPVSFNTMLDFTGLPKGPGYIKIKQDDPSGGESGREIKEILIPIMIE